MRVAQFALERLALPESMPTALVHMRALVSTPCKKFIQACPGRSSRAMQAVKTIQVVSARPQAEIVFQGRNTAWPRIRNPGFKPPGRAHGMFLTSSLYSIYLNSSSNKQGHFLWTSLFFLFKSNTCCASNTVGRGLGMRGPGGDNWARRAAAVDKPPVVLALSPGFSGAFLAFEFHNIKNKPPRTCRCWG